MNNTITILLAVLPIMAVLAGVLYIVLKAAAGNHDQD